MFEKTDAKSKIPLLSAKLDAIDQNVNKNLQIKEEILPTHSGFWSQLIIY